MIDIARLDFPNTKEGFKEFKGYVSQYLGTEKMKLLIVGGKDAVLRTRLATRYDSAYIRGLSEQQIKELEQFVGDQIEVWHPTRLYWDEVTKIKEGE